MNNFILMYIDPGTGSMLFAVLIGIIGAVGYMLKSALVKLRFALSSGKRVEADKNKLPLVIFSDDKRYWSVFKPVCEELNNRGFDTVYMTASADDKALENEYEHIDARFIGAGNKAFAKLNFLNASIVLSTTPGLDVFQWKRSKDVDYYVHITHSACDITGYHMFGVDYYDALLLSGQYQLDDIRELEELRSLPKKEVKLVGIPYMDEMVKRLEASGDNQDSHDKTVLLAPSWGESSIFSRFGGDIIDSLLETDYHIIVRPHPQSFVSDKELMDSLMSKYPESSRLEWNRDSDNFDVLKRSDILISDFSGIIYDFSLAYDKPVIYTAGEYDTAPYDAWWLDKECWKTRALSYIGQELTADSFSNLKSMLDECLNDSRYTEGRQQMRDEAWVNRGESARLVADYIIDKYNELNNKKGGE